ncbi:MAG TPA: c-type cytochrome biogenesis protein CcsB [Desulfobacterales bacterium]|jgi:cytochrome c-type biogenesis protein CcsB|nr:c-type cytochrome biogenesis protein CcsB [Desulfobacterales bacterium]
MEAVIIVSILLYLLSAGGYLAYLFLQRNYLQRASFSALIAGFVFHTLALALDSFQQGHFPATNMRETLSLAGWATAGVFILLSTRYHLKILGVYAAPIIALIMVVVSRLPDEPAQTTRLFKSFWLVAHVIFIFIGEAAFALACGAGILYLLQENSIKTKKRRFFFKRLPSLDLLDSTGYACIVVGFTLLTVGLITGLIYAKSVWGRFWSWDPKEVWSGISWLFYAALLHERLTVGWRGRRSAIMAIIGFGVLVFTFLGVNLFMEGHHKEFTR